ncbi:MAG: hypothetical protein IJA75_10315 [Oscillospiraceae bacterium]|nr:hypothetical protein [Oscillospiraceae bacterium]
MKTKKTDLILVVLFCAFLVGMMLLCILLPRKDFSELEKRNLAEVPRLDLGSLASGEWGADVENYLADHLPGRDFLVGLNAYFDLLTGRQAGKDIWVRGGRLQEAPVDAQSTAVDANMQIINNFAAAVGRNVDLMVIPSAGWAGGDPEYPDEAVLEKIADQAGEAVTVLDMQPVFAGKPELYYRTDHHWTSAGAYGAYVSYMEQTGKACRAEADFRKEVLTGCFRGSTYSRSALWLTPAEDLELWHGSGNLTVTNGETEGEHSGVFYRERLEEADKYTVFLDGNHSIVRIHNPEGEGKLLVVRDSYSNCLGCFLAESYEEVVLIDLRYYRQPVSQLLQEEEFENVLICYSIGNFLTDVNLIWLR